MNTANLFLTPAVLVSPATLANAFASAVSTANANLTAARLEFGSVVAAAHPVPGQREQFGKRMDELIELRKGRVGMEWLFKATAEEVARSGGLIRNAAAILEEIPEDALARVREEMFPSRAAATSLAASEEQPTEVRVEGRPVETPKARVRVYGVEKDPTRRVRIHSGYYEKDALLNMVTAIERYLPEYDLEQTQLLNSHVRAIISGEIAAPEELRSEVIKTISLRVGLAAAYGEKVLQEAMLARKLAAPVPVIPEISDLVPREEPVRKRRASSPKDAAAASHIGLDGIGDAIRVLGDLQEKYGDIIGSLGRDNPAAFSAAALAALENAGRVMDYLRGIKARGERIRYLYDAQMAGLIPPGYLRFAHDRREITLAPPAEGAEVPPSWRNPIEHFVQGEGFKEILARVEAADPAERARSLLRDLFVLSKSLKVNIDRALSDIGTMLDMKRIAAARMAMVRLRAHLLANTYGTQLNEMGLAQMDVFSGREWLGFLDGDSVSVAEVILDFAHDWAAKAVGLWDRMDELSSGLKLSGEDAASSEITNITRKYLRVGDLDAITGLYRTVRNALDGLKERAGARDRALSRHIRAAFLAIIESARSLGALADAETRRMLAEKIPPVVDLLGADTRLTVAGARKMLEGFDIPLPGDPDVPALETLRAGGFELRKLESGREGVYEQSPAGGDETQVNF